MKWFRMWNDFVNDVRMLQLSDYEFRMWTYLLAYASESDCVSGELQVTFKLLSLHFHQRFNHFSRAIETFQNAGLITVSDKGIITITNWNKRQFQSDDAYARVKKFRQVNAKRNVSCNGKETFQKRFKREREERPLEEKEEKKGIQRKEEREVTPKEEKEKSARATASPDDLPNWIPKETWDAFVVMRKGIKKPITPAGAKLLWAKLLRMKNEGRGSPREVLEQSIMNSWQGVFELKQDTRGNGSGSTQRYSGNRYGRPRAAEPDIPDDILRDLEAVNAEYARRARQNHDPPPPDSG